MLQQNCTRCNSRFFDHNFIHLLWSEVSTGNPNQLKRRANILKSSRYQKGFCGRSFDPSIPLLVKCRPNYMINRACQVLKIRMKTGFLISLNKYWCAGMPQIGYKREWRGAGGDTRGVTIFMLFSARPSYRWNSSHLPGKRANARCSARNHRVYLVCFRTTHLLSFFNDATAMPLLIQVGEDPREKTEP